jgi:hypothetical protein
VGREAVTIPHRLTWLSGTVTPYRPGQFVRVQIFLRGHLLKQSRLWIVRSGGQAFGHFGEFFSSPGPGTVTIVIRHHHTKQMQGFIGYHVLAVLNDQVGFGSRGPFVKLLQSRLSALHFYIPQTGVYDEGTGLALDAYHRLLRWGTYQTLDSRTVNYLLDGFGAFPVRFPGHGRHAEGNLTLQLLALVDGSRVVWIFPISSGKPSTPTILGDFQIYERAPGYLSDGMYYSDFFYRGYAIHGYDPAPDYPASHGCMRLPIVDAIPAYNWLAMGDWVDVYY